MVFPVEGADALASKRMVSPIFGERGPKTNDAVGPPAWSAPVRRIECKPAATWSKVTESFGRTCCDEVPSRVIVYPLGTGVLMTCVLMTTTIAP